MTFLNHFLWTFQWNLLFELKVKWKVLVFLKSSLMRWKWIDMESVLSGVKLKSCMVFPVSAISVTSLSKDFPSEVVSKHILCCAAAAIKTCSNINPPWWVCVVCAGVMWFVVSILYTTRCFWNVCCHSVYEATVYTISLRCLVTLSSLTADTFMFVLLHSVYKWMTFVVLLWIHIMCECYYR